MKKVKVYTDHPFSKKGTFEVVDVLSIVPIVKKPKTNSEIAAFHLFNKFGLNKGLVKFSDGTIQDNVFFDPKDLI